MTFHSIRFHDIPLHSIELLSITFHSISLHSIIYVYPLMPPEIPMAGSMLRMGSLQPSPIPRRRGWWFSGGTIGIWNKLQVTGSKKFMMFMDVYLVGGLERFIFHFIYGIILPIDELHHFSEGYRSTTNQESFDLTIFITWEVQLCENLRFKRSSHRWKFDLEMSLESIQNWGDNHFHGSVLSSTGAWIGDRKLNGKRLEAT